MHTSSGWIVWFLNYILTKLLPGEYRLLHYVSVRWVLAGGVRIDSRRSGVSAGGGEGREGLNMETAWHRLGILSRHVWNIPKSSWKMCVVQNTVEFKFSLRAGVVAQGIKDHVIWSFHVNTDWLEFQLFHFWSSFSTSVSGEMTSVLVPLSPAWETQMNFQTSGFSLAQSWLFRKWDSQWKTLSFSISSLELSFE